MGDMRMHAIVVTSWGDAIEEAHRMAHEIFDGPAIPTWDAPIAHVTEITPEAVNGYRSFMVAPDGSKEGWAHSDCGDLAREHFTGWLHTQAHEDGSNSLKWVEVFYGDENYRVGIVSDGDEKRR